MKQKNQKQLNESSMKCIIMESSEDLFNDIETNETGWNI